MINAINDSEMALTVTLARLLCIGFGMLCSPTGNSTSTNVKELMMYATDNVVSGQLISKADRGRLISNHANESQRSASVTSNRTISFSVSIDTRKEIHIVDRRYLSTGFGTKELTTSPSSFDPQSPLQQTLLRGLSPAVFRVGGRSGDETLFTVNGSLNAVPRPWINVNHFLTGEKWKILNEFTTKCGVDLAYTLNVVLRKGKAWDPTNTKELLDFNADLGYKVIWQLGNEPERFKKNYDMTIPAVQLAKDFITLRGILSEDRYSYSNELVGPDMNHLPITSCLKEEINQIFSANATAYLERFLHHAGESINATTVHFYNLRGGNDRKIFATNLTDPDVLKKTRCELQKFRQTIQASMPLGSREKWLGETSSVSSGGVTNLSNRYPAGFVILHNLGLAAQMGISIFVYWNFLGGGSYSLVLQNNGTDAPSPLYWACFLHKRLLGTHVLSVSYFIDEYRGESMSREKNKTYVHVFAHCTLASPLYQEGAVTVMALNLHNNSKAMLHLTDDLANKNIDEYLLTPEEGNLTGRNISLNGQVLKMKNSTHFPDLIPRPLPVGSPIVLPPQTYGFYVIRDANAPVCRKNKRRHWSKSRNC